MPGRGGIGGVPLKGAKEHVTMGGTQRNTKDVAVRGRGRLRGRGGAVSNGRGRMRRGRKVEVDKDSEEDEEDDEGNDGDEPYIPAPNLRAPAKKRGWASKSTGRPRKQKKVLENDEDDEKEEEQDDSSEENQQVPISDLQSHPKKTRHISLLNTPTKSSETDEPANDAAPAPGPYKYPRPEPRPLPPSHTRQHAPPSPRAATGYYVSRRSPLSYSPPPPTGDPRNYDPRNSEPAAVVESRDQGEEQQPQEVSQNGRNYPEGESVVKPKKKHTLEDEFKLCAQKGKAYAEHVMSSVVKREEMEDGIGIGVGVGVGNGGSSRRAKVGVRYGEFDGDKDEDVEGDVDMEEETRRDGDYNPIPSNTSHANINSNNRPPPPLGIQRQNSPPRHSTRSRSTPPPIPPNLHNYLSTEIARVTQLMNAPFSTLSATERAERINRQTTHKKLGSKQNGVGFGLISPHDSWQHAIDLDDWICVEKIDVDGVDGGVDGRKRGEGVVRWRVWAEERVPRPVNPRLRDPKEITQYRP